MPQRVLDVIAEDPEVEHVARDMEEAAMEEHRSKNGDHWGGEVPRAGARQATGDQPEFEDEGLGRRCRRGIIRGFERKLIEEGQRVGSDEAYGHKRNRTGGNIIF